MNTYHALRKTLFVGLGILIILFLVNLGTQDKEFAGTLYPITQTASVKNSVDSVGVPAVDSQISETDILSNQIYMGSQHPVVLEVENQLKKKGYFTESPDTIFDQSTKQAVQDFQKSQKFTQTGELTGETFVALFQ